MTNLWTVLNTAVYRGHIDSAAAKLVQRAQSLRAALGKLAGDNRRPNKAVCKERLEQLYALYEKAAWQDLQGDLDYLLKFADIDKAVIIPYGEIGYGLL